MLFVFGRSCNFFSEFARERVASALPPSEAATLFPLFEGV
jgi:hypothetical protein